MEKMQYCKTCKQDVRPKLDINLWVCLITLLLFWPATLAYIGYKLYKKVYICPMCGGDLEVL